MTFNELRELVEAVTDDPVRQGIHLGCDCGCGGEYWTPEMWNQYVSEALKAYAKLKELGITFPEEDDY